jgi:hypothetical protein
LEAQMPEDHLLRRVAEAVDFAFVRRLTARFYGRTGRPGLDPVVLFKTKPRAVWRGLPPAAQARVRRTFLRGLQEALGAAGAVPEGSRGAPYPQAMPSTAG